MSSSRTYYTVLGITRLESAAGIRSAFRELARRYHPDRVGHRGTAFFQEIVQAYQTLSDPDRRADYDRGLEHVRPRSRPSPVRVSTGPARAVEPLIPAPRYPEPVSLRRDFDVSPAAVDEVFQRIRRNFQRGALPKSRRVDTLDIDLLLSPGDALRGGVLSVGVPVFYPCRQCRGSGRRDGYACVPCGETGMVTEEQPVHLRVPPGVRDGALFRVPLGGLGIHNLALRVRVRIR